MDDRYPHSAWYDQGAAPQTGKAKKPRARRGLKITMLCICGALVLLAAVYGGVRSVNWTFRVVTPMQSDAPKTEDELPDDFRSFFEDYFQSQSASYSGSSLDRADTAPELSLELQSAAGLPELSLQQLYRSCVSSVVGIRAYKDGQLGYSWGTGIVMRADGYILTNEHVIDGATRAAVVLADGTEYDALLVGEDTQTDIALLKIDADGLPAAVFGSSDELTVGDGVVAIGNPLSDQLSGTMTDGIVSAISRSISVNGRTMTLIQTTAALNQGNSGGPLFNMYGQVVGITNMKMSGSSSVAVEGLGFAIPSATVKAVADQLLANGEVAGRPGIGITVGAITDALRERYELPDGLYVSAVSAGSDAEAKGVQVGDVLTAVDDQPVSATDDVLAIRNAHSIGDKLSLTLWRDGEEFTVEVELQDLNRLY